MNLIVKISTSFITLFLYSAVVFSQSFNWDNVSFQGMGFVTGINIHPADPEFVVVRTDVGGNYRWDGQNKRWKPLLDKYNAPGVSGDAMSESDPNRLYSITSGSLLFRSDDRGETWTRIEIFPDIYVNANSNFYRWGGKRLVVDPNNGGSVLYYASESNGLWRSPNFGVNWQQVNTTQVPVGEIGGNIFVAIDKNTGSTTQNSTTIYVGVQKRGIYKTTNGGQTWALLPGGPDPDIYYPVSGAIASNGTLYITYSTQASEWVDGSEGRIYKYSGENLVNITPANNNRLGFNGIDVDPINPERVIALQWKPGQANGIHITTNGGASWAPVSFANRSEPTWFPTYSPWTYTGQIMFDRANSNKTWKVNGFGVYVTENIGVSNPLWKAEMNNLEELVAGQVHVPPVPGGKAVFSIVMDKVAFVHNKVDEVPSRGIFDQDFGIGTGMDYCAANPSIAVIVGSQQVNVSEVRHKYTTNNGQTWYPIQSVPQDFNNGNIAISATDENLWVWAPQNEAGSVPNVQMHYSTDMGKTWQPSSGIPTIRNNATHTWAQSLVLASDRVNGNYFYYYLQNDNSSIYHSDDGGVTFEKVYSGLPSHHRVKLKAVPGKEGHLFFYAQNGVLMHSNDYGSTWNQIPGFTVVKGIGFGKAFAPSEDPAIYVAATKEGQEAIYLSKDNMQSWENISHGNMPAGKVSDLSGDMRTVGLVYAATGGRGVMYGKLETGTSSANPALRDSDLLKVFPNPVNQNILNIKFMEPVDHATIHLYNLAGARLMSKYISNTQNETLDLACFPAGTYFLAVDKTGVFFKKEKVILIK